jgi:hypothetical protein
MCGDADWEFAALWVSVLPGDRPVRELESFRSISKTPLGLWLPLGLWSGLEEMLAESLEPIVL